MRKINKGNPIPGFNGNNFNNNCNNWSDFHRDQTIPHRFRYSFRRGFGYVVVVTS
jgi:hypothetical protein